MPDKPDDEYWVDSWGTRHLRHPPDYGLMGPHPSGSLPSRPAARPPLRVLPPVDTPESTEAATDPTSTEIAAPGPSGIGSAPPGLNPSSGVWVGNVWQERPPKPPVDPVTGARLLFRNLRAAILAERDRDR